MKKMITVLLVVLLFISCDKRTSRQESVTALNQDLGDQKTKAVDNADKFIGNANDSVDGTNKSNQADQQVPPKIDWDKKIIKNATLNLEVKDFNSYNTSLRQKIKQFGGYVAQEEQSQSEYKIETTVTIKVPVDQFDDVVNSISTNVKELKEKKISSQDVTTEVIDTRSRIETKKQVRLKYLDLLKQARNMEEILSVQSVVNGVQEEIESAAGRIEYLSHASSFSTIHLTFYQVLNIQAVDADKPSFATRFGNAFRAGWDWIGELSIIVISIWPLLLLIFGLFIFYKRSRKPRAKQV